MLRQWCTEVYWTNEKFFFLKCSGQDRWIEVFISWQNGLYIYILILKGDHNLNSSLQWLLLPLLWKGINTRIKFPYFQNVLILIWHSSLISSVDAEKSTCVKKAYVKLRQNRPRAYKKTKTIRMCCKEKLTFLNLQSLRFASSAWS